MRCVAAHAMSMAAEIAVEVAFALPEQQRIIALMVPAGCSAFEAAERSRIAQQFGGLVLGEARMGIFGKVLEDPRRQVLAAGDRVEIYRPLVADPREARRARATQMAGRRSG